MDEERVLEQLVGCYFAWRHDQTDKGDGARIALSSVMVALGFDLDRCRKRLAEFETKFPNPSPSQETE